MRNSKTQRQNEYIGNKIKELRITHHVTMKVLASILGVSMQQVAKYEKGTNKVGAAQLELIAKYFNIKIEYFYNNDASTVNPDIGGLKELRYFFRLNNTEQEVIKALMLSLYRTHKRAVA